MHEFVFPFRMNQVINNPKKPVVKITAEVGLEKFGPPTSGLVKLSERILADNHYELAFSLFSAFRAQNGDQAKIYFAHSEGLHTGLRQTINFREKNLDFIVLADGSIAPTTYCISNRFYRNVSINLFYFAEEIYRHSVVGAYLNKDKKGYYIDNQTYDNIYYWTKTYSPKYFGTPYQFRPLDLIKAIPSDW